MNHSDDFKKKPLHNAVCAGIFFFGFSCLVYQVVWQRLPTLYCGVGSISIAVVVSAFMPGLGTGGLIGRELPDYCVEIYVCAEKK